MDERKSGIKCTNVHKKLDGFEIKDISFEMPGGYILGLIGRNGCGKTTLIRTLMGLYRMNDSESDISADGISIMENVKDYKGSIAYVLNENTFGCCPVRLGAIYGRYYSSFDCEKYLLLLSKYGIKGKKLKTSMYHLSAGEKIKVQLAFAQSYDAKLYIFDEPTGNLDPEFRDEFYRAVRKIVSTGEKTVIYATHLLGELDGFADYILWMQRNEDTGTMKFFGTTDELKENYRITEGINNEYELELKLGSSGVIAGGRKRENHSEYLIRLNGNEIPEGLKNKVRYADLKEIMYYEEKGGMV